MNQEQKLAFIQSQILCASAEIEGMKAENAERALNGYTPSYNEQHFYSVPEKYGLTHNQILDYLVE